MPHLCMDPVVIGAEVVTALQNVVARRIDPLQVPVLTIATFQTGESYNVIPERVKLAGTLRTHHKHGTRAGAAIDGADYFGDYRRARRAV